MKIIRGENRNAYKYQKLRALERKLYLIDLRGGKCEICGYAKNLAAFDFHHKNPSHKEGKLDMRKLSNSSMEWIMNEFSKCEVLCANCHREKHSPDLMICKIRERTIEFKNSTKTIEFKGKPKCTDCGVEINYTYIRCRKCKALNSRKKGRPMHDLLEKEVDLYGRRWASEKYKVTVKTIGVWLKKDT